MNAELMLNWAKTMPGQILFTCRLLAWSTFDSYMTEQICGLLKTSNIDMLIPGGQTKHTKALDLLQNKPFFRTGN